MTEPNSQNEKPKERRYDPELLKKDLKCDLDQYEMLKRCSEKKDVSEWNEWRKQNPNEDILLEGSNLPLTNLRAAQLWQAHLEGAKLQKANLEEANLNGAHLDGAKLHKAILKNAEFWKAHLENAVLLEANLRGAYLTEAKLQGADFSRAIVDGDTLIWTYEVDPETKFEGVGLDAARIYPRTRQLLEYNTRRMNWEEWYRFKDWHRYRPKEKRGNFSRILLENTVGWFWCVSNYGLSTWRIIGWFSGLALFFAALYSNMAIWLPPGVVSNLETEPHLPLWHYFVLLMLRPVYFSVATMTTLGFGDMYANSQSILGHILLTFQVILGYVLLGALVTRFAVLFTAGGPAGKFADEKEKEVEKK